MQFSNVCRESVKNFHSENILMPLYLLHTEESAFTTICEHACSFLWIFDFPDTVQFTDAFLFQKGVPCSLSDVSYNLQLHEPQFKSMIECDRIALNCITSAQCAAMCTIASQRTLLGVPLSLLGFNFNMAKHVIFSFTWREVTFQTKLS